MLVSTQVRFFPLLRSFALAAIFPLLTSALAAETASFSQNLTPADRTAAGYDHLSAPQVKTLDAMIQRDVQSARQGDVVAFAKSFSERRSPEERQRIGLDQLTDAERGKLDALVAAEVAKRPMAAYLPTPRPQAPGDVDEYKPHAEVHGQVSLFVGGSSHGGSFYGGSFDAVVIDPSRRFMVGVGMSEVRGRGWHGCYDELGW